MMNEIKTQINKIYKIEYEIINKEKEKTNILLKIQIIKQSNMNLIINERRNNKLKYFTNEIRENELKIRLNMDDDYTQKENNKNNLQYNIKKLNIELNKEIRIYEMLIKMVKKI